MPELIEHIDAIARQKQRAVLYLEFHRASTADTATPWHDYSYTVDEQRSAVVAWLDARGYQWGACGAFAELSMMLPYLGQIFLEVPYDESSPEYRALRDFLEHPDGSMRYPSVRFCVMPLDYAMRNAAHDAPGFWERWAEEF
jgi:hypothetical protein